MKHTINNLIRLIEYFGFEVLKSKGLKKTFEVAVNSRNMLDNFIEVGEKAAGLSPKELGKRLKLPEVFDDVIESANPLERASRLSRSQRWV
jgi:hypothetical protein